MVPTIPSAAWFIAYAVTVAACFHWHNRQPSRHLLTMACGMSLVALLILPAVFSELAGHEQLARMTDGIMGKMGSLSRPTHDSGYWFTHRCRQLSWIGLAFFALGFWRLAKDFMLKAEHPQPDPP